MNCCDLVTITIKFFAGVLILLSFLFNPNPAMTLKKTFISVLFLLFGSGAFAQTCDCVKEFLYIKNFMETNYPGFADKKAWMTDKVYDKMVADHLAASKEPHSKEDCLLVIYDYLSKFKDHHISVRANFDAGKMDSAYFAKRPV